jgi:hypothetical protein
MTSICWGGEKAETRLTAMQLKPMHRLSTDKHYSSWLKSRLDRPSFESLYSGHSIRARLQSLGLPEVAFAFNNGVSMLTA